MVDKEWKGTVDEEWKGTVDEQWKGTVDEKWKGKVDEEWKGTVDKEWKETVDDEWKGTVVAVCCIHSHYTNALTKNKSTLLGAHFTTHQAFSLVKPCRHAYH